MQLLQDRIGSGRPLEGLTFRVVCRDKMVNALHELLDARKRPATDCLVGDEGEEALDLVQPRAVGRDEMHMPARSRGQPCLDLWVAVGGVVVHDAVDVQFGRDSLVDLMRNKTV